MLLARETGQFSFYKASSEINLYQVACIANRRGRWKDYSIAAHDDGKDQRKNSSSPVKGSAFKDSVKDIGVDKCLLY